MSQVLQLRVVGMSCSSCVRHVEKALTQKARVQSVRVDLAQGLAEVTHDGAAPEELLQAIQDAGYEGSVVVQG